MRNLRAFILKTYHSIWQRRGQWLRGALCWAIGMTIILADVDPKYDRRLQVRKNQTPLSDIVLVQISQNEWINWQGQRRNWIRPLKEIDQLSDSFYWNRSIWQQMLGQILKEDPVAIGISFFFGENIRRPRRTVLESEDFNDSRIIWSAHLDTEGRAVMPRFASAYGQNSGLNELNLDRDGVLRRLTIPLADVPHITTQLAQFHKTYDRKYPSILSGESQLINYRGTQGSFPSLTLTELLNHDYPDGFLKGKIVIIGSLDSEGHIYRTPVGQMSRAEVLANSVDNIISNDWIYRLDVLSCALLLLGLLVFAIWVMNSYPQAVAFVIFFWTGVAITTFSIWAFDHLEFWTPVMAPLVLLIATYMIFISLQLALKDYLNLQLEQERKFLFEVEELKNNFVRLISHDLKTPIAKIQAICDRLIAENPNAGFVEDIQSLRNESSELNRYIRTILHISRVEAIDFKINIEAADLNEVVENVIHQVSPLAQARQILIREDLEPMFLIDMDTVLIQEVIHNLLTNAIKYTPEGGQIHISTKDVNNEVMLTVEDNGPGISKEDQSKIFDKFFRGAQDNAQIKGSGLGLYLVKYFVELHKGQVFVDSTPQKGTKVGFSLPVAEDSSIEETKGGVEL